LGTFFFYFFVHFILGCHVWTDHPHCTGFEFFVLPFSFNFFKRDMIGFLWFFSFCGFLLSFYYYRLFIIKKKFEP